MTNQISLCAADAQTYWNRHETFLRNDVLPNATIGAPITQELRAYFFSAEYRGTIDSMCERDVDPLKRVFFLRDGVQIGFCAYCTYLSEDQKCFIIDFCIYPPFRNQGYGAACFAALRENEPQADCFELNLSNENNRRFWSSVGFRYNGYDEHGSILYMIPPKTTAPIHCQPLMQEDEWQLLRLQNGFAAEQGRPLLTQDEQTQLLAARAAGQLNVFAAMRKTRVVGICVLIDTQSHDGVVQTLFVEPLFRRCGIAKQLTAFALEQGSGRFDGASDGS